MPGDFTRNADFSLPTERMKRVILATAGAERTSFINATEIATVLFGNSIAANMFMLGFAFQRGGIPLGAASILKAIEINGEAVKMNLSAFEWGRRAAHDPASVEALTGEDAQMTHPEAVAISTTLDEVIDRRVAFLTAYQSKRHAQRYRAAVERVRAVQQRVVPGDAALSEAVARYLFKLMAVKDEYEVARLYTDGAFMRQVEAEFEGKLSFEFHLAPPFMGRTDSDGNPRKTSFGPWMMRAFRLLAPLKVLRGTPFDLLGRTQERRMERKLVVEYEALIAQLLERLTPANNGLAVALASIPEKIRGYGHVKLRHLAAARAEQAALLEGFMQPEPVLALAAE